MTTVLASGPQPGAEDGVAMLAAVLAPLVGAETVDPDSDFFDDLGADSLVMAQFCARVRKHPGLGSPSIRDVYAHPTITELAAALGPGTAAVTAPRTPVPGTDCAPAPVPARRADAGTNGTGRMPAPASTRDLVVCGVLQLIFTLGYGYLISLVLVRGITWIPDAATAAGVGLRSLLFGVLAFLITSLLPVTLKWLLVGRWRPGRIRIWSLRYVRFWIVRTLLLANPLRLFAGTPVYTGYLRLLGTRIGPGVLIQSSHPPICTDLITIGAGSTVRRRVYLNGYRARAGVLELGPVTLGEDSYVGESSVLEIDTVLGDRAQLAHASALLAGQQVPAGERRMGSPAEHRTEVDQVLSEPLPRSTTRTVIFSLVQLLKPVLLTPIGFGAFALLLDRVPVLATLVAGGPLLITDWRFYPVLLLTTLMIFVGVVLLAGLVVLLLPRLLNHFFTPGRTYPVYGLHHELHNWISALTNIRAFTHLFGDSVAIPHYLRAIGWDTDEILQTGTNFGLHVEQENPYLTRIGTGTVVADGLLIGNADFCATSFTVAETRIGAHNFIGNDIAYPPQGRTGDNCLLATKVMIPIDGPVREDVGLLGSPSFVIPRSVHRDNRFDHLRTGVQFRRRLLAKTRHNVVSMLLYVAMQFGFVLGVLLLLGWALDLFAGIGAIVFPVSTLLGATLGLGYFSAVERAGSRFRQLRPQYCSIYHPYFWTHERYWKLMTQPAVLNGTPLKGWGWRLLGVRVGRRLYDDGSVFVDKSLISIGDDCALNAGSIIQPHSQEDGAFKCDTVSIGSGCTIGTAALVHYGVTIGDDVELAADSFLMKGEEVPSRARWGGNPAREL